MMKQIFALIIISFGLITSPVSSFASELKIGFGHSPENNQHGISINAEYIGNSLFNLYNENLTVHPAIGLQKNLKGYISSAYSGLMLRKFLKNHVFLELFLGGAIHDGPLKKQKPGKRKRTLGSRILFREFLSLGYLFDNNHNASLFVDHISNADLTKPNSGVSNIGIRYGISL